MKNRLVIYLVILSLVVVWCAGIIAAPLLRSAGMRAYSDDLYSFYAKVCHQSDARSFHLQGEKIAVCHRCTAVYFGFLAGLLLMPLIGRFSGLKNPRPVLLLIISPMLLDALLNITGVVSSSMMSRLFTGALFGVVMPYYALPAFTEAFVNMIQKNKKYP